MSICTLTESAQDQINKICKENNCFAVGLNITGGGCAGFQYDWTTIESNETIEKYDEVINAGEGNLVIGSYSVPYLIGTEIDYIKNLTGAQFEIRNPNARSSCGCGVSVNFDTEYHNL